MTEGTLVASSNSGRYAIDDPTTGRDITSGTVIQIYLNGEWVAGSVEHTGRLYAIEGNPTPKAGYYFIADKGGRCGLCTGMKVRVN